MDCIKVGPYVLEMTFLLGDLVCFLCWDLLLCF
jgi:hypothetical protein